MPDYHIEIIKDPEQINVNQISDFVDSNQYGNIFQHPDMFHFYQGLENYTPVYLVIFHNNKIVGSLLLIQLSEVSKIKKHLTRRIIVFGDPIIDDVIEDKVVVLERLLKKLQDYINKNTLYIQFRLFKIKTEYEKVFLKNGYKSQKRLNSIINTENRKICWLSLSESKRRQLRKSAENGARIVEPDTILQLREFYLILSGLFKEKVKKPIPDFGLFIRYFDFSKERKLGKFFLVEFNKKIIGGIVCPVTPGKCIYEWYICGLDKEHKSKGIYPSVMATWAAIEYACENGIREFDLMGAGKPGVPYGVRDFKTKFGGDKVESYRYNKIVNRGLYEVAEVAYNLKRWLG